MLRSPLATISSNRRYKTEYSPYQRGIIVGAIDGGATPGAIQKAHEIPKSTAQAIVRNARTSNDGQSAPRSGRPKSLSIRDQRHTLRIARRDPKITYAKLAEQAGVTCSHDTIYRLLEEEGIINWLAKKRPLLTPELAAKRYAWTLKHESWGFEEWATVIWSDECSVERGTGKRREWVFRTPNQKWHKDMIQPYKKGKDVSIMVWACFWGLQRSDLYASTRDATAKRGGYSATSYLQVLDDNLLGIYEPDLIYMQDNGPIHTAKKVKKWFDDNGIMVMEWPPYSPDLNPIEHLWFHLKELVYKFNPDIERVEGNDEKIRETLFEALFKAWQSIDEYYLHDLVWSMERRVKAIIASEGWYTRY